MKPNRVKTPETEAARAAMAWYRQYSLGGDHWKHIASGDSGKIYHALVALGENPAPSDVDRIIGNDSWTKTDCDSCGNERVPVAEVGEDLDYESRTADLCLACLKDAAAAIEEGQE